MASTRSTTPEDRFAALEVSNHGLQRQLEAQREEISGVRNGLAALTTAIEQLHRGNHNNNNDGESVNNSRGNNIGNNGGLQA
jgi:hypothetical protein